jgi:hypothetical protein
MVGPYDYQGYVYIGCLSADGYAQKGREMSHLSSFAPMWCGISYLILSFGMEFGSTILNSDPSSSQ